MIKKLIFIFVIFSSVIGELSRIYLGNSMALSLLDISSLFSLLYILFLYLKKENNEIFKNLKYFLWFFGACLISLIFNLKNFTLTQILISSLYLVRFISYSSIYFLALKIYKENKNLFKWSLFSWGILFIILGILQYFLYPNLRNLYYLGWDDHLYRLFSTFLDPDFAGVFIASFIFYLFSLLDNTSKLRSKNNWLTIISIIISFASLLLTYSRGAFIAFFFSFILFVIITKNKIYKILLGVSIILFIIFAVKFTSSKLEPINLFRTYSINQREISLNHALNIFSKNPILGIGFNTYRYEQEKLGYVKANTDINHSASGTDNSFIFVLATSGIIGFIFYLILWIKILSNPEQRGKSHNVNEAGILRLFSPLKGFVQNSEWIFCSLVSILIGSLFVNALFYPAIMSWYFCLIGYNSHE